MTAIPKDPFMLLSWVNMKLRDHYSDLEQLCDDLEIDRKDIEKRLESIGYTYDKIVNKFW